MPSLCRGPRCGRRARLRRIALCALLAGGLGAAVPAVAHVRWSVGVGIGVPGYYPGWGPGWWAAPYTPYDNDYGYVYGAPVIVAPPPVVYAPWQPPAAAVAAPLGPPPPSFWYYCYNPAGYYPQVPYCPGGWTPVPARPASPAHPPAQPAQPPAPRAPAHH